jgi:FkbH-like protein
VSEAVRLLLLSDFNLEGLRGLLENLPGAAPVHARVAPMGQVLPALLDPRHELWSEPLDGVVLWTRLQGISQAFGRALRGELESPEAVHAEVEQLAELAVALAARVGTVFVPTWVLPPYLRGLGSRDLRANGIARLLLESNLRLAQRFEAHPAVVLLNAQRWIEAAGSGAQDPKYWYMGKIPFSPAVFQHAASDMRAALAGLHGHARKLVVVDLDDTLWGGIVGDDGVEGLRLGGHDAVGEAFADFQDALLALRRRGVLLAIASKNDEELALDAIRRHPEMRLSLDDFVAWRINWEDKAKNVVEIVRELNLGLQSVVFLDDNPAERARVREALPEVLVPELPKDKMHYAQALHALPCFDVPSLSDEDLRRTEMYASERERTAYLVQSASLEEWLASLGLEVGVEPLLATNVKRVAQLLNKTNQMNLSTRRLTEAELGAWLDAGSRALWSLRVQDRFGDSGLTGIVSVDCDGESARIVDFVLSCRVFGRKIEQLMVKIAVDHARACGKPRIVATYIPTEKNKPTLEFWESAGFAREGEREYAWETARPYPVPEFIRVRTDGEAAD